MDPEVLLGHLRIMELSNGRDGCLNSPTVESF